MPRIVEHITLPCTKETALKAIGSVAFMKNIDLNYGTSTTVLLENGRVIRSVSVVEGIGPVEIERLMIPEANVIITQRRPPMGPFVYQLTIQAFTDSPGGTLLEWTDEYELNGESREKEDMIRSIIVKNDKSILEKTRAYLERSR
jgi:hypothetical protein